MEERRALGGNDIGGLGVLRPFLSEGAWNVPQEKAEATVGKWGDV